MTSREAAELYEKMYYHELKRKEVLNTEAQWPMGILVVLAGALFFFVDFLVSNAPNADGGWSVTGIVFATLIVAGGTSVIVSFIYVARVRRSPRRLYAYMPAATRLETYRRELSAFYSSAESEKFAEEMREFLARSYSEAAAANRIWNTRKTTDLGWSLFWLFGAIIVVASTVIPYGLFKRELAGRQQTSAAVVDMQQDLGKRENHGREREQPAGAAAGGPGEAGPCSGEAGCQANGAPVGVLEGRVRAPAGAARSKQHPEALASACPAVCCPLLDGGGTAISRSRA